MSFTGNLFAGVLGGEYGKFQHWKLFGAFACLAFITFIILLFFIPKLNKSLKLSNSVRNNL